MDVDWRARGVALRFADGTTAEADAVVAADGVHSRVREIWFNGITLKTARPHVTHWLRRLSVAIQEGTRRVTRNRAA